MGRREETPPRRPAVHARPDRLARSWNITEARKRAGTAAGALIPSVVVLTVLLSTAVALLAWLIAQMLRD